MLSITDIELLSTLVREKKNTTDDLKRLHDLSDSLDLLKQEIALENFKQMLANENNRLENDASDASLERLTSKQWHIEFNGFEVDIPNGAVIWNAMTFLFNEELL